MSDLREQKIKGLKIQLWYNHLNTMALTFHLL
jgi:hypothetical protein